MNRVVEVYFGKQISIFRPNGVRLYKLTNRNHVRLIRIVQPELLAYLGIRE